MSRPPCRPTRLSGTARNSRPVRATCNSQKKTELHSSDLGTVLADAEIFFLTESKYVASRSWRRALAMRTLCVRKKWRKNANTVCNLPTTALGTRFSSNFDRRTSKKVACRKPRTAVNPTATSAFFNAGILRLRGLHRLE